MITQYKRQHPPQFGRSCTCVETVQCPEIEELAERFLCAIDYYGLAELEFKRDARDGQLKLLDVYARTWGYHALGGASGVDFPHMLFEDQVGKTIQEARSRVGRTWVRLLTDLPTATVEMLCGRLNLRTYLKSVSGFSTEAVFSRDDPLPALVEVALLPYLYSKKGF
jgi:predicted ATP-grasp superfamily ATP-dependent carboligase